MEYPWLAHAEALPTGQSCRIECTAECGSGKTLIVNHSPQGYSAYCFRCGPQGFQSKGYMTLAQLAHIREMDAKALAECSTLALPINLMYNPQDWPVEARMWLYEASIYGNTITDNRISYAPDSGRVMLPVYQGDRLVFFQARRIFGQGPKYMGPSVDRSSLLYRCGCSSARRVVVIVEDILSAIRVGKHIPTCSLLGTKITTAQAAQLSEYATVVTWLDPDKAGVEGALSVRKILALTSDVYNITTPNDPKHMSDSEIQTQLKAFL